MTIEFLRTPEDRFAMLPNFPFQPNYIDTLEGYEGLRMHYVDEGNVKSADTYLCLHGEPTWSYLYRKMIPIFTASSARVIAPDYFGFGRSDKPIYDNDITFSFHRGSLLRLIENLDLEDITLVCQDWGGVLGLTLPMEMPKRFKRLIVMNTVLPEGKNVGQGFDSWKGYAAQLKDIPVSGLLAANCPGVVDLMDITAYAAPFPDERYQAGVRRFPQLLPITPDMEGVQCCKRAKTFWSSEWDGETFMAVGLQDPFFGKDIMDELRNNIKNCPESLILEHAGHFVQEWGEEVAIAALTSFGIKVERK